VTSPASTRARRWSRSPGGASSAAAPSRATRVAPSLIVLDAARQPGGAAEEWQERRLNDGSRHRVYKRFFTAECLADEVGGGRVLHAGHWFVLVATPSLRDR